MLRLMSKVENPTTGAGAFVYWLDDEGTNALHVVGSQVSPTHRYWEVEREWMNGESRDRGGSYLLPRKEGETFFEAWLKSIYSDPDAMPDVHRVEMRHVHIHAAGHAYLHQLAAASLCKWRHDSVGRWAVMLPHGPKVWRRVHQYRWAGEYEDAITVNGIEVVIAGRDFDRMISQEVWDINNCKN